MDAGRAVAAGRSELWTPRFDHLIRLSRVLHHRAHSGMENQPRLIEGGGEEIELVTAGSALFDTENGGAVSVRPGSVLWHLAGETKRRRPAPGGTYQSVIVRFEVTGEPRRQVPLFSAWAHPDEAAAFSSEILQVFQRGGYDPRVFCHYVYGRFFWHAHLASQRPLPSAFPEALSRALAVIDARFLDAISVEELAANVGYSTAHLHHLFREHLRRSPYQIITERRLDHARRLLATSDLTVKDVGARSGFADAMTFSRVFRRHVGQTPVSYRKAHAARTLAAVRRS